MADVTVRTRLGELTAPRGFGAAYQRAAAGQAQDLAGGRPGKVIATLRDLLALVGFEASAEDVAEWDAQRRVEAEVWAVYTHLRASDNPVRTPARPSWMRGAP